MTDFIILGLGVTCISEKVISLLTLLQANSLQISIALIPGLHLIRRLTHGCQFSTPGCCIGGSHLDFRVLKMLIIG